MSLKIFLTGATGYIGGDALYAVSKAYPDAEITLLIRDPARGASVTAKYPEVRLAFGSLDSFEILEKASAEADIVIHTADSSDNLGAANAIGRGLLAGHSKEKPGYWLHVSGTGILTWYDQQHKRYGQSPIPENAYDDWDGVDKILSIPDTAFHRNVDKEVQSWSYKHGDIVKVAIVCPPAIYGAGRGPENQRSRQVYQLCEIALKEKKAPVLGRGLTEWDNVHIQDLSCLFVLLIKAALDSAPGPLWGPEGYYFVVGGVHQWGALSKQIAKVAKQKGLNPTDETFEYSAEQALAEHNFDVLSWGMNSKGRAKRASQLLGWSSEQKSLEDTIPEIVDVEAGLLKLKAV